jgi:hypothetical protein
MSVDRCILDHLCMVRDTDSRWAKYVDVARSAGKHRQLADISHFISSVDMDKAGPPFMWK